MVIQQIMEKAVEQSRGEAPTQTKLTKITVSPEAQGFRLSIEGFVPFAEVPELDPLSPHDKQQACLEMVREAFPELIPAPWRDRTLL